MKAFSTLEFPLIRLIVLLLLGFQKQPHSILLASSPLDSISKHSCGLQDCVLWVPASIYFCVGGTAKQRMPCWERARSRPRQEASRHSFCQIAKLSLQYCRVPGPKLELIVVREWIQQHACCIPRLHWELWGAFQQTSSDMKARVVGISSARPMVFSV